MKIYSKIKKEHLFIFLLFFTALVLFTYFEEFEYTSLTTKQVCTEKGYQCCEQGEGINYFSLDYSCPNNKQCWTSCMETKEINLITTSAVWNNIWSPIKNFFIKLFEKKVVGFGSCISEDKKLFKISDDGGGGSHAELYNQQNYEEPVCPPGGLNIKRSGEGEFLIRLSDETNAQVEDKDENNYQFPVYVTSDDGSVSCNTYQNQCQQGECVFSINSLTNAHVKDCDSDYLYKVCCSVSETPQNCGNGEIDPREQCDDGNTNNYDACLNNCQTARCGDGVTRRDLSELFDEFEQCDDGNNRNNDGCSSTCRTETVQCNNDGVKDPNEECDGTDFLDGESRGSNLCNAYNPSLYSGGILTCNNCRIGIKMCIPRRQPPPLTQSNYEVYWANDGIIAFSFDKYIERIGNQLSNIDKLNVYRSTNRDNINQKRTILKLIRDSQNKIHTYLGTTEDNNIGYDDKKYDFWDYNYARDNPNLQNNDPNKPLDNTRYYYKIVPVDNSGNEINPDQQAIIEITPQPTNPVTVSGSCNNVQYPQCSQEKPNYCGVGDNLINNNGFEQDFNSWYYNNLFNIINTQNHLGINSKVMHVNIQTPVINDVYNLAQIINVEGDTYYRLSAYIKAQNISDIKPILHIGCYANNLNDGNIRRSLISLDAPQQERRPANVRYRITNNNQWINYNYIFRTYKGANKCNIYPIYFIQGSKGEVWIDGLRLEKLTPTGNVVAFNQDCGICGCPTNAQICQADGTCAQQQLEEDCTNPTADEDNDGIKAILDSDCSSEFGNYLSIEETTPSTEEAYTNTNIQVDCKYKVSDSDGNEKRLGMETKVIKDCIKAYISTSTEECENKVQKTTSKIVSFRKCNTGQEPGEEVEVVCKIKDTCSVYPGEGSKATPINIREYEYCSEISDLVEFDGDIRLNSANEPGEELKINGKIRAIEPGTIIIKAALIDLQNDGRVLKETFIELDYESETTASKSFELSFEIPPTTTNTYFVYLKAFFKNQESDTCTQTYKTINIISDEDELPPEEICENEDVRDCFTELPGICKRGAQECINNDWGLCTPTIQPGQEQETCNDNLDNNCDGQVDEGCLPPPPEERDSDRDTLPDEWEMQYFGNLFQGPNDDYDDDGISNYQEFIQGTNPLLSDKKKPSLIWLWIIIGIVILGLIIFFVFKFLGKTKGKEGYVDPRLKAYVQDSLKRGFTKHQIRQALLSKGWSQKDIDKAIK